MGSKPRPVPKKLRRALTRANPLSRAASSASSTSSQSAQPMPSPPASSAGAAAAAAAAPPERVARAVPPPRGGLLFDWPVDRALADRQRASLRFIAARFGGQLLSGNVSLRSTAMPVHLNEPRSFLQRLPDDMAYADVLLGEAAAAVGGGDVGTDGRACAEVEGGGVEAMVGNGHRDRDLDGEVEESGGGGNARKDIFAEGRDSPLALLRVCPMVSGVGAAENGRVDGVAGAARRLALVAAYLVSGLHSSASLAKAFNPHLGETYSATFGGADARGRVDLEQTRHHPPVSHFCATIPGDAWRISGYASFDSNFRMHESALYTRRTGVVCVDFGGDERDRVVYNLPVVVMRGILGGDRRVDVHGPCSLYYERYGLVMDLLFDPMGTAGGGGGAAAVVGGIGGVVSAGASLFPTFGLFGGGSSGSNDSGSAPAKSTTAAADANARDSIADAVRGVLYQVDPSSATAFSGAFSSSSEPRAFFGDPDGVAAAVRDGDASGSATPAPIELRADKDVVESVKSAWAATIDEDDVEPVHDTRASPSRLGRRILALASGSWLSHFDVAGERLWDLRCERQCVVPLPLHQSLPSDSRFRADIVALEEALALERKDGDNKERDDALDAAQTRKEEMEDEMRARARKRPGQEHVGDSYFPSVHVGVNAK